MGILKIGIKELLRNKGKTFVSVIGITIAVILISGINISTSSLTVYNVQKSISDTHVDVRISTNSNESESIMEVLNTVKSEEESIEAIFPSFSYTYYNNFIISSTNSINWAIIEQDDFNSKYFESGTLIGVDSDFYSNERFKHSFNLTMGRLPTKSYEIMLEETCFNMLSLALNNYLALGSFESVYEDYKYQNKTYTLSNLKVVGVIKILDVEVFEDLFSLNPYYENHIFTTFESSQIIYKTLTSNYYPEYYTTYNVLIDHDSLNVFNYEETLTKLRYIANRFEIEDNYEHNIYVYNALYYEIQSISALMASYQIILMLISIPIYLLGLLLSMTLMNISIEKQEIKYGQYLSKGASKKQIAKWIFIENSIYSIFGGVIGVFGGYLLSLLILQTLLADNFTNLLTEIGLILTPSTFIYGIIAAFIFTILALIKPLKHFLDKNIALTSKKFLATNRDYVKIKRLDWLILIFSIIPIIFTFILTPEVIMEMPFQIQIFIYMIYSIVSAWTPFSVFFLIYASIKLFLGKFSEKFIELAKKILKPFSKFNYNLFSRNLLRDLRRTIALIFMIAFTVSFLIVSSINAASQQEYERETIYMNVGADIRGYGYQNVLNEDLPVQLNNYSDKIETTCPILQTYGYSNSRVYGLESAQSTSQQYDYYYGGQLIYGIDPNKYQATSDLKPRYFSGGNHLSELSSSKNVTLMDENSAEEHGYRVGDAIRIKLELANGTILTISLEIKGLFKALPGLSYNPYGMSLVCNIDYLEDQAGKSQYSSFQMGYLIDIKDQYIEESESIAENLGLEFSDEIYYVVSFQEQLDNYQTSSGLSSIYPLMSVQNYLIMLVAVIGLILLLYENFSEREVELGVLRARGFEKGMLIKSCFTEGAIIIIYGLLFGMMGFLGAYLIHVELDNLLGGYIPLERAFIFPLDLIFQFVLMIGIMLSFTYLLAVHQANKTEIPNLSKLLKV